MSNLMSDLCSLNNFGLVRLIGSEIKYGYVSDKTLILSLVMCFRQNSNRTRNTNIKTDYVSDKILILSLAMFQTNSNIKSGCFRQNSNIKSGYVSDKILILGLAMFQTKF